MDVKLLPCEDLSEAFGLPIMPVPERQWRITTVWQSDLAEHVFTGEYPSPAVGMAEHQKNACDLMGAANTQEARGPSLVRSTAVCLSLAVAPNDKSPHSKEPV